ncbi:hypothetical protein [Eikenella glucosivorans]|nr:hypothetical protein [Eikenella glucosivorans]
MRAFRTHPTCGLRLAFVYDGDLMKESNNLKRMSVVVAILFTSLPIFGATDTWTLWSHWLGSVIFYSTTIYSTHRYYKIDNSNKDNIRNSIYSSQNLIISQVFLFAILVYGYISLLDGIKTSSMLQAYATISMYVSFFSIPTYYKLKGYISELKKTKNIENILGIPPDYWSLTLCAISSIILLSNIILIYCDIREPNTYKWLFTFWGTIFSTIIFVLSNTFETIISHKYGLSTENPENKES